MFRLAFGSDRGAVVGFLDEFLDGGLAVADADVVLV